MSIFSSYKKIFLLGFISVILIAIPFSVYVAQKRQSISSKADASTSLSFDPASTSTTPIATEVGKTLILNVVLDPKTGVAKGLNPNQIAFVKLSISFDPLKFTAESLKENKDPQNKLNSVLEDAVLTTPGKATISLSIGADPANVVTTTTKIAILQLKALSATDANSPSSITFDPTPNTQVLSIASSDQTSENVLSTAPPAVVTIASASTATAPTTTPTASPTPTTGPSSATTGNTSSANPFQTAGTANLNTGTQAARLGPIVVPQISQALPRTITLPPTGPSENILGIGAIGAIFTIIGGALLILL